MGYSDFDIALLNAWDREHAKARGDPARLDKILKRRAMSTYTRPLRSWSLVLRACDSRIEDNNSMGLVRMDGARIKQLCSPVSIPYPGVSLDDAARAFGVNRTTVARWASPAIDKRTARKRPLSWWQSVQRQMREVRDMKYPPSTFRVEGRRLMLEHYHNKANPKHSETRVWTPGYHGLDPGGEVYAADWGALRIGLAEKVDPAFEQQLERLDRFLGIGDNARMRSRVWQWICPSFDGGCGRTVYKLYLPMPFWTLVDAYAGKYDLEPRVDRSAGMPTAFLCLRCAGLVYESAERSASPGRRKDGARRRVNAHDRFLKRISGGVLTRKQVLTDS